MMNRKLILRLVAVILGILGITVLASVVFPIINYELTSQQKYPDLLSPVAENKENIELIKESDLTRASNWFIGGAEREAFYSNSVSYYTITISKLKINNATVAIGGEDLSKNLIQYPGTAIPGKRGNAVIFGHSVLPIFFNPKDYMTMFSTLPNLKKGDEIFVNYDGVSYKYKVENMFEVMPTDIQVLEQDSSDSFLTLVTCVPPGDPRKPKRLIVRARIVFPS